jgi:uncharacterized protein (TIGR03790 family)
VIINKSDPLSVEIGRYYQQQRQIPEENLIWLEFSPDQTTLSETTFQTLWLAVNRQARDNLQAFALTWAQPYRVSCMSITTAFALGFDPGHCAKGCEATLPNPYFNRSSTRPYQTLQIRPTMAIAATTLAEAKKLIDRGIAADGSFPPGTAYLVSTSDKRRNVRSALYPISLNVLRQFFFQGNVVETDHLQNQTDVMFYFTGKVWVEHLETNRFLPGAIADHLTSLGGQLTGSSQMSSLRWLEAGATGSYGAVVEPCNFIRKFPQPQVVMFHYLQGDTLVEAYWKSVEWPGQGIFIGEPLAKPFRFGP